MLFRSEANVDIVSSLLVAARQDEQHAFPTAIVLPRGACADELRWFDRLGWRPISPKAKAFLDAGSDASFKEMAIAAYARFPEFAVAGVSYHF